MKKLLPLLLAFTLSLLAEDLTIGVGSYFQTQPYKNTSTIITPSPVLFYDNGIVYARWTCFGVYIYGHKADKQLHQDYSWGFSLTIQPRPYGYKPSDSTALRGLDEKKSSLEGGVAYAISRDDTYLEAMLLTDILRHHNFYIAKVESGLKYKINEWSFYPSISLIYESKKFTDYYYGINVQEANRTIYDLYQPNGGVRAGVQTYISYPLTKKWSVFFNLHIDRLTNPAKNSPIVSDSYIYSGLASLLYTF
ncbi:MltA-interacting protein precursor [hydrothermal vent metagenome]|uniref:MltA-interacting protein n=1 Tax=hydrothermal vent metagenome TaxID=652676 RepID=A0A1W1BLM7_9ZZZZ